MSFSVLKERSLKREVSSLTPAQFSMFRSVSPLGAPGPRAPSVALNELGRTESLPTNLELHSIVTGEK